MKFKFAKLPDKTPSASVRNPPKNLKCSRLARKTQSSQLAKTIDLLSLSCTPNPSGARPSMRAMSMILLLALMNGVAAATLDTVVAAVDIFYYMFCGCSMLPTRAQAKR